MLRSEATTQYLRFWVGEHLAFCLKTRLLAYIHIVPVPFGRATFTGFFGGF